jgi:hypothetical protein
MIASFESALRISTARGVRTRPRGLLSGLRKTAHQDLIAAEMEWTSTTVVSSSAMVESSRLM